LLKESFGRPVQLKLLFRASEHNFSAAAFHARCDHLEDTLTLVRTQFGRTIAGFSHYQWNGGDENGEVCDEGRQAFLLSLDQGEKYLPQNGQGLVYCYPSFGPMFGAGDLCLGDDCRSKSTCYANFPVTYNREGGSKIVRRQQSYTDFSGATANCSFRVLEYEVFRVLFE
jgi:hypothetical protein